MGSARNLRLKVRVGADMPRYHLQICESDDCISDEDGLELPSLEAAVAAAEAGLKDLLCEDIRFGRLDLKRRIEITDDDGRIVAEVRAADLVRIDGAA